MQPICVAASGSHKKTTVSSSKYQSQLETTVNGPFSAHRLCSQTNIYLEPMAPCMARYVLIEICASAFSRSSLAAANLALAAVRPELTAAESRSSTRTASTAHTSAPSSLTIAKPPDTKNLSSSDPLCTVTTPASS